VKEGGLDQAAYAADSAAALQAYPAVGGRLNSLSKAFLVNYEAGKRPPACADPECKEANSLVRVPPLVARFGASPEGLRSVEAAIRVHMSNDLAIACALAFAVLLERAIQTGDAPAALLAWAATAPGVPESTKPFLAEASAAVAAGRDVREVGVSAGLSCGLPGSLTVALTIAATFPDDYVTANRANMVVGGDSASRAAVVGGLLAARAGGVPEEWLGRLSLRGELEESAAKLASARFA
jgi:ADP-ribosylglycohydrolase